MSVAYTSKFIDLTPENVNNIVNNMLEEIVGCSEVEPALSLYSTGKTLNLDICINDRWYNAYISPLHQFIRGTKIALSRVEVDVYDSDDTPEGLPYRIPGEKGDDNFVTLLDFVRNHVVTTV